MSPKVPFVELSFQRRPETEMLARSEAFFGLMDQRRTVREFSADPIPEGLIENAIRTASTAPSGAHKQPWHFCVVTDPEIKHKIRLAAEEEERQNYNGRFPDDWLEDLAIFETNAHKPYLDIAPALIVIFKENYRLENGERKKNYYVNESVGIATGMLIAALHYAGLASLTHTPNPMAFLNEILGRPKNEVPVILLPVGYPAEGTRVPDLKRKPLEAVMTRY
ncbi:MAG: nitroreductase family protein [Acidobacteria bacterium]|nr:nitroreductase family protein [Acidobacteriota bacterium]MCB9398207.1 nitroreductase family protein [Acidobacteriota bacterium]